jgi:hypothetical protein
MGGNREQNPLSSLGLAEGEVVLPDEVKEQGKTYAILKF